MALPFFYDKNCTIKDQTFTLDEETSKHVVQVLRMKKGHHLTLTNGRGLLLSCSVDEPHKKQCTVMVDTADQKKPAKGDITIAISLVKNASRFEWFLEKATELGITSIVPLLCERTEKDRLRYDRMMGICISAMLQSQQPWLPELSDPVSFNDFISTDLSTMKLIAHCEENKKSTISEIVKPGDTASILIGPEGDFSATEIIHATGKGLIPVTLGSTRLRTETAGIVSAVLLTNEIRSKAQS